MIERHPKTAIAVILSALVLYVPLYDLYYFGVQSVFGYFAHDAFYYLTIAKNSSLGFFTFDGERATNGFHPLWQYILTAVFSLLGNHGSEIQLYATYMLCAVLTTVGLVLMGWSLYLVTRSVYLPVWLVPGPFYLLFTVKVGNHVAQGLTYTYSPWAFMNGMESPCSVAAGGLFLYLLTRSCFPNDKHARKTGIAGEREVSSRWGFIAVGLSLSLVVLARLDNVFLALSTGLYVLFLDRRDSRPIRNALLVVLPTVVALTAYMAFNYLRCGSLLPISGIVKSTAGAAFTGNVAMSLCDLFPPLAGLIRPTYSLPEWGNTAIRSSGMVLPMIFGLWLTWWIFRNRTRDQDLFNKVKWLLPITGYLVLKTGYNLVNVRLGSQGYWYNVLPVLLTNYLAVLILWRLASRENFLKPRVVRGVCIGLYVLLYLFTSANAISNGSFVDDRYYPMWRDRKEITAALKKIDPVAKFIDRSDGVYAYALGMPAMAALGYAIDHDGYTALKNDTFVEYCLRRGFNITFEGPNAYPVKTDGYRLKKIYEHKASGTTFLRIEGPPSNHKVITRDTRSDARP